jgi:hypothetical protein
MSYVVALVLVFVLERLHFPLGVPLCLARGALSFGGKLEYPGATMWPVSLQGRCSPPHVFVNGWSDRYQVLNIPPAWSWCWVSFGNSHNQPGLVHIYKTFVPIWSWYIGLPIQDWFVTGVRQVYALLVLKLVYNWYKAGSWYYYLRSQVLATNVWYRC